MYELLGVFGVSYVIQLLDVEKKQSTQTEIGNLGSPLAVPVAFFHGKTRSIKVEKKGVVFDIPST